MYVPIGYYRVSEAETWRRLGANLLTLDEAQIHARFHEHFNLQAGLVPPRFFQLHSNLFNSTPRDVSFVARRVLAAQNRLVGDGDIPFLSIRFDPTLSVRGQEDILLSAFYPKPMESADIKYPVFAQDLTNACTDYVMAVKRVVSRAPIIRAELNACASHILWTIIQHNTAAAVSQKELSFLMTRLHPFYSSFGYDRNAAQDHLRPPPIPKPVQNPIVMSALAPLFAAVLEGPQSKFLCRLTTGERFTPVMSLTPYTPVLATEQGYIDTFGQASELDLVESVRANWDTAEQIAAAAETAQRVLFVPSGDDREYCTSYHLFTGPLDKSDLRVWPIFDDLTQVQLRWNERDETFDYVFMSEHSNRREITRDPTLVLLHLARLPSLPNQTPVAIERLGSQKRAYLDAIRSLTVIDLGSSTAPTADNQFTVYYYASMSDAFEGKLTEKKLDATPFLNYAGVLVRPLLAVYALQSMNRLWDDCKAVVENIFAYLSLTRELMRRNELAVAMSWNGFVMSRIWGRQVTELRERIAATTKGGVV